MIEVGTDAETVAAHVQMLRDSADAAALYTADLLEATAAEMERLRALVEFRFKDAAKAYLQSAGPDGKGAFQFDIRAGIVPLIAEHLAASFKAMGGENYVQMEVSHDELGPLMLTIQRKYGELPAAIAAKERERADRAEGALRPFAEYATRVAMNHPGWDHDGFSFQLPDDDAPTMREFRRARETMEHNGQ